MTKKPKPEFDLSEYRLCHRIDTADWMAGKFGHYFIGRCHTCKEYIKDRSNVRDTEPPAICEVCSRDLYENRYGKVR